MTKQAQTIVQATGERLEFPAGSVVDIIESMRVVAEYLAGYDRIKKQLQAKAQELIDQGEVVEHDGYHVRTYTAQRMNYDVSVLREVFDEDTLATFMEPVKKRVDEYIKEHLTDLGDDSKRLRDTMQPAGKSYSVVRLERLDRQGDN